MSTTELRPRSTSNARRPASHPQNRTHTSGPTGESELRLAIATLRHDLYVRALRMARSPSLAEDLVQDTIIRALRFEAQYRPGTNPRAWLGQILRSVFLTLCRRQKRERRAVDHLTTDPCEWTRGESPVAHAKLSSRPARALARLPEGYRRAVELVDLGDASYQDAAAHLGVPVGTIMSRLHRGRRMLAEELREPALAA